ncbi:hypothetical protein [Nonomuraea sp. SYSU D8015]|uniref:hypothetical protein n=1 Tax=Nonomuraea sp. SYSU D8015 TaxID=2593644 RepID=UPI001CB71D54|nr:hypothetical protein [Nonomuraea sp. SYSU D8015]
MRRHTTRSPGGLADKGTKGKRARKVPLIAEVRELCACRRLITVLERQLVADTRVRFAPEDRASLAALLASLPREILHRLRLLVRPDTVLRRHCRG